MVSRGRTMKLWPPSSSLTLSQSPVLPHTFAVWCSDCFATFLLHVTFFWPDSKGKQKLKCSADALRVQSFGVCMKGLPPTQSCISLFWTHPTVLLFFTEQIKWFSTEGAEIFWKMFLYLSWFWKLGVKNWREGKTWFTEEKNQTPPTTNKLFQKILLEGKKMLTLLGNGLIAFVMQLIL